MEQFFYLNYCVIYVIELLTKSKYHYQGIHLTGGVAEYCFSIDEIGKTIFPK